MKDLDLAFRRKQEKEKEKEEEERESVNSVFFFSIVVCQREQKGGVFKYNYIA